MTTKTPKAWIDMTASERKAYWTKANKAALAAFKKLVADKKWKPPPMTGELS